MTSEAAAVPNTTPTELMTPETYLGPQRLDTSRYVGSKLVTGKTAEYTLAGGVPANAISYGGEWTLAGQTATAGLGARLELHFEAEKVYIVLGGTGRVTATLDGKPLAPIDVDADRLYTVVSSPAARDGLLDPRVHPRRSRLQLHLRLTPAPLYMPDASRSALPFRWAAIRSRYHSKLPFGTRSCVG